MNSKRITGGHISRTSVASALQTGVYFGRWTRDWVVFSVSHGVEFTFPVKTMSPGPEWPCFVEVEGGLSVSIIPYVKRKQ